MTIQDEIERKVLARMAGERQHSHVLKRFKPLVDRLVSQGFAKRTRATPQQPPLWLEITPKGQDRLAELRAMR